MRNRPPRQAVITAVSEFLEPFTIDALYHGARQHLPGLGRATVYRTLTLLIAENSVHPLVLPSGERLFVTDAMGPLAVLYCECCGQVRSVRDPDLARQIQRSTLAAGFRPQTTPVCLTVRCGDVHSAAGYE